MHVTPVHYYQAVPDTREFEGRDWERPLALPGVDMNEPGQLRNLEEFSAVYKGEYSAFARTEAGAGGGFFVDNGAFERVDCETAYCFVRRHRPSAVVEVGGGNSTLLLRMALLKNSEQGGTPASHTVIEPFPGQRVRAATGSRLIEERLERVPEDIFFSLKDNDILFVDSSHVLKTGNDVHRLYLDILPRLAKGVLVHIHDIFFPFDYPRDLLMGLRRFFTEQYLLQAFLTYNKAFKVEWGSAFLSHYHPGKVEAAFPTYKRGGHLPGSFWMRKVV